MTTTAPTHSRPARLGGVATLPASLARLAPEPVQAASAAFGEAQARVADAAHELRDAREAVDRAARDDRHAADLAVVAGEPLPAASELAARARLAEAERRVPACERAATTAQADYIGAVREHRAAFARRVAEAAEDARSEANTSLDVFASLLMRCGDLANLGRELSSDEALAGRSVLFRPRVRERLGARQDEGIAAMRSMLGD